MDVGAHVWDYFRRRGYSPAAVAGILGNTRQESSNNPNARGGGLIQGQDGRTSSGTLQQQLQGIDAELRGPERATAEALKRAGTPQQAALIFSQRFERPGIPMNAKRQQYAAEALKRYSGREVAHASAAASIAGEITPHLGEQGQAQSADLSELLKALVQKAPAESSVAGTQLARPASSGGSEQASGTPRVPAPLGAPQPAEGERQDAILSLVRKLSQDSEAQPTTGTEAVHPEVASGEALHPNKVTALKGVVQYDGKPVDAWIAHILQYVESKGVKPEVESGYRSEAEQEQIYNSGVRPAAKPGSSKHELKAFPGGAVDLKNAAAVAKVLARSPYAHLLVYAGARDPVHFSHPVNGTY